jgi:glycosyltransferase involved in cell wall biosynthesis
MTDGLKEEFNGLAAIPGPRFELGEVPEGLKGKLPVSICLITFNAARLLRDCLNSVSFASQIVVVDAQSTDGTPELARHLGAEVYSRPWPGFTEQRNYAVSLCRHEWILSLDSDERVTLELAHEIAGLLKGQPRFDAYQIPELNNYFGRWLRHGGIYPDRHIRLFKAALGNYQTRLADVHEGVRVEPAGTLSGHILHFAYPDFDLALAKLNRYTTLEAEGRFRQNRRPGLYGLLWRPVERFIKNYLFKRGFLDGTQGFVYCFLTALYAFSLEAKLWNLSRQAAGSKEAIEVDKNMAVVMHGLKTFLKWGIK